MRAHHVAVSLSWSFWELLEELVSRFRLAELLSFDFQMILHFADEHPMAEDPIAGQQVIPPSSTY